MYMSQYHIYQRIRFVFAPQTSLLFINFAILVGMPSLMY